MKEDPIVKLEYLSLALACLLISDDHLLNWFLYPKEFNSRSARHNSFITDIRIKKRLGAKTEKRVCNS